MGGDSVGTSDDRVVGGLRIANGVDFPQSSIAVKYTFLGAGLETSGNDW